MSLLQYHFNSNENDVAIFVFCEQIIGIDLNNSSFYKIETIEYLNSSNEIKYVKSYSQKNNDCRAYRTTYTDIIINIDDYYLLDGNVFVINYTPIEYLYYTEYEDKLYQRTIFICLKCDFRFVDVKSCEVFCCEHIQEYIKIPNRYYLNKFDLVKSINILRYLQQLIDRSQYYLPNEILILIIKKLFFLYKK